MILEAHSAYAVKYIHLLSCLLYITEAVVLVSYIQLYFPTSAIMITI
jgi:hypothetical protein